LVVYIGGNPCTNIQTISNQQIECDFNVAGVGSNLVVNISLNNSNGFQRKLASFSYARPTVISTNDLPETGLKFYYLFISNINFYKQKKNHLKKVVF